MKHRQVKHFGYEFDYDNNGVRFDTCDPIPKEFENILNIIQCHLKWNPNQITVNKYLPGQGKTISNLIKIKLIYIIIKPYLYNLFFI